MALKGIPDNWSESTRKTKFFLISFLVGFLIVGSLPAQEISYYRDSVAMSKLPRLTLDHRLKSKSLPYRVDNSVSMYFPPIFQQHGWSCNQSSSIAYVLSYEMNVHKQQNGQLPENQLTPFFPWNFLNSGMVDQGASYFDSWEVVKAIGCPSRADFGFAYVNETKWMSGYNGYYRGMTNRVEDIFAIDVGTEEGLLTFKHWLFDHMGAYQPGGMANFQIASIDMKFVTLPEGTEEEGKKMIPSFKPQVGHAMSFVGYNDSVRYDWNNDGKYTNDIDINGDGKVTMYDWEIGALICANTYGTDWADNGKVFIPYRILAKDHLHGGIWMQSVVVAKTYADYQPQVTMRCSFWYPKRNRIRVTAGVSQNPNAQEPEHILDVPVFRYQGGDFPMQGNGGGASDQIEIGLDLTPLLEHLVPGQEAAFFLVMGENDENSQYTGKINHLAFFDYTDGVDMHYFDAYNITIENGLHYYRVRFTPRHQPPAITTDYLPGAYVGQSYVHQLQANEGEAPYHWLPLGQRFEEEVVPKTFPEITEEKIIPVSGHVTQKKVSLPFDFPFYGTNYRDMTIKALGAILFEEVPFQYPYAIDKNLQLSHNVGIYPYFCEDIQLPYPTDWVYYQADETMATIRWNVSLVNNNRFSDGNFAVQLYPDGVIEYYYGYFQNRFAVSWTALLAGGSSDMSHTPELKRNGIYEGLCVRFTPDRIPTGMSITSDGMFHGTPEEPGESWDIPFRVKDQQGLVSTKVLNFSTGAVDVDLPKVEQPAIHIYPNPASDHITIQLPDHWSQVTGHSSLITLHNLQGKLMKKVELVEKVDIRNLKPGIYIVQVSVGDKLFRERVVVR